LKKYDQTPLRDRTVDGRRERFCKKHQGWWPLEKFVKAKNGRGGYLGFCRACRSDQRRATWKPEVPRAPRKCRPRAKPLRVGIFNCRECKVDKPIADFHINRGVSRGHCSYCRECDNALRRKRAA